ncbi:hypothetical protein DICPUDRAFT_31241 [Dictyostelium purpureum]|uniref:BTB domain-containing protein n=1 Tax=Dictyostelium purpureum TaxID=5786 RepID=F0ZGT7_DICPU|nr:uncharacterized protein DICPUDRAFT_31241 [Dictyostelium purpureum]EGC36831.1 hypothetical protein DICPUDRAFT_31241 [Dictyostelium purpureum]|eukprot:XP_003286629.1 hypothetical protein DICPUDRAFT_31241 [Dictyostelium purpureum]
MVASADNITIYITPIGLQLPPGTTLPPFLMKRYTLFKKLFSHISHRFNIEESSLIFIYHDVVDPEQCPNDIDLNSDETIIVRKKLLKTKPKNPTLFEKNIASLFHNPIYSDISFKLLDGSEIKAHKNILSSRCQKFQAMFQTEMKESQQKEIEIVNYEPGVFRKMIEYIYSDSLKEDNIDMILQLIVIADEYLLDSLKSVCEMMLVSEIDFNNIALFLLKSDIYNCKQLKKSSMEFALANVKRLIEDKEFIDVIKESPVLLLEIINEMAPVYDSVKKKSFPINNA